MTASCGFSPAALLPLDLAKDPALPLPWSGFYACPARWGRPAHGPEPKEGTNMEPSRIRNCEIDEEANAG